MPLGQRLPLTRRCGRSCIAKATPTAGFISAAMPPDLFLNSILDPGLVALFQNGGPAITDAARRFLLAIAFQESGPKLEARYQNSPSASAGPAHGWWQFEQDGGVAGVWTHPA